MCERQMDRRMRPVRKNNDDVLGTWTYKDLPKPLAPCAKTCRLLSRDIPDCTTRRRQCLSSFPAENVVARLTDERTDNEDWNDPSDPFNNTATGYLGVRRQSMLSNPLLVKHKVGTPFQCCRQLPCSDFIYGSLPAPSPSSARAKKIYEFLALNRAAVTAGTCGHEGLRDFRNTHRVRFARLESMSNERRAPPITLDPNATFGKPTSYISTASEIMSGQEQTDWLRYVKACHINQQTVDKIDPWKENHAYTLRMFKKPTDIKPDIPWHMPKFERKAKPRLSTFRRMSDAVNAHNANNYEKIGRDGMFGQGITTKACNKADALCCFKP